ncbi:hypothetical protein SAMN05428975_4679 [Mucilaginibacter sp. OK268]|uniref:hypothetical protein n=1 Tax=Mucilaginibacter sp. OK268 TaxID=1881048 RepID=UPI0008848BB5|nr:hypothetical protein [Mucilaginibacter sp. OK268]SDP98262.1 hypothetical protein SAMN05428975_4679 [Mucilaginibacter sp. OK268]
MSEKKETKGTYSFRLNLDELTPDELYAKLKKLENDALKEAGESISGGTSISSSSVVHGSVGGTFSRGADCL